VRLLHSQAAHTNAHALAKKHLAWWPLLRTHTLGTLAAHKPPAKVQATHAHTTNTTNTYTRTCT